MGLPLLAIPESMMPKLAEILREGGIQVESIPVDKRDDPARFLMRLACTDGKSSVALSIQREPHVNTRGPVIVIVPQSKIFQMSQTAELSDRISELLQERGAWIPTRDSPVP